MDGPQEIEFARLLLAGISIMLLLALAVILFVVLYQRKLFKQQIKLQEIKAEYQSNLMSASIQAQEKERKRIASDLHDEVGATLSAAKLYASQIKESEFDKEKLLKLATTMDNIMDDAIVKVREISQNLLPPTLEQLGLKSALNALINRYVLYGDLNVKFRYDLDKRLPIEVELNIFRIVQELINNTLKHAKANQIDVELIKQSDLIQLKYKDDGVGYDQANLTDSSTGLGLSTLTSRSLILGAEPKVFTKKGEGMSFSITFKM